MTNEIDLQRRLNVKINQMEESADKLRNGLEGMTKDYLAPDKTKINDAIRERERNKQTELDSIKSTVKYYLASIEKNYENSKSDIFNKLIEEKTENLLLKNYDEMETKLKEFVLCEIKKQNKFDLSYKKTKDEIIKASIIYSLVVLIVASYFYFTMPKF